jgi:hypothetical protein
VEADLALSNLFPHHLPVGNVSASITNNGPDTVTNAGVTLECWTCATPKGGGMTICTLPQQNTVNVTLNPGQTADRDTGLNIDTNTQDHEVTCNLATPFNDPNPANNSRTQTITSGAPPGPATADLAITNLWLQNSPQGNVFADLTNHGPDPLTNLGVTLDCWTCATPKGGGPTICTLSNPRTINVTLNPGQMAAFDSQVNINITNHVHDVTCTISAPINDPGPGNNNRTRTFQ